MIHDFIQEHVLLPEARRDFGGSSVEPPFYLEAEKMKYAKKSKLDLLRYLQYKRPSISD